MKAQRATDSINTHTSEQPFSHSVTQTAMNLKQDSHRALGPTSVQAGRSQKLALGPGVSSPQAWRSHLVAHTQPQRWHFLTRKMGDGRQHAGVLGGRTPLESGPLLDPEP